MESRLGAIDNNRKPRACSWKQGRKNASPRLTNDESSRNKAPTRPGFSIYSGCDPSLIFDEQQLHMDLQIIPAAGPLYEQMKALRLDVLLNPIGVPASYIDPEKESRDLLVGAFEKERIIGCCILSRVDDETLQLRQMAVDTKSQGTGVGAAIIEFAEAEALKRGYRVLMMHARDVVIPFYERCGYSIAGSQFFEVGIPHHRMQKELS
ncbi:MAG: family N-acetyltransferase [Flaviaesturariibacter sp.]|nr:family N-acetyltransferase [Flaviaesturariibacter sp.]